MSNGRARSGAVSAPVSPAANQIQIKFDAWSWKDPKKRHVTFTQTEKDKLVAGTLEAIDCSRLAVEAAARNFDGYRDLVLEWFGADNLLHAICGVRKMHAILTDSARWITFVDARGQSEKFVGLVAEECCASGKVKREKYDYVGELPMRAGDYAYVKTVKGGGCQATAAHVGSGMKVYMGERFFHPSKEIKHWGNTVYHELGHKVLGTTDHAYGADDCRQLAKNDPARAINCADCWSFFITSLKHDW